MAQQWNQTKTRGDISSTTEGTTLQHLKTQEFHIPISRYTGLFNLVSYFIMDLYNFLLQTLCGNSIQQSLIEDFLFKNKIRKKQRERKYNSIQNQTNLQYHSNTNAPQLIISEYITQPNPCVEAICSVFSLSLVHGKPWPV